MNLKCFSRQCKVGEGSSTWGFGATPRTLFENNLSYPGTAFVFSKAISLKKKIFEANLYISHAIIKVFNPRYGWGLVMGVWGGGGDPKKI